MKDGDHLVFRRLEKGVLYVAIHDVQDFALGRLVPAGHTANKTISVTVGVTVAYAQLQRAGMAAMKPATLVLRTGSHWSAPRESPGPSVPCRERLAASTGQGA